MHVIISKKIARKIGSFLKKASLVILPFILAFFSYLFLVLLIDFNFKVGLDEHIFLDFTLMLISLLKIPIFVLLIVLLYFSLTRKDYLKPFIINTCLFLVFLSITSINSFDCQFHSRNGSSFQFYSTKMNVCYMSPVTPNSDSIKNIDVLPNSDPSTFQSINSNYAKDANNVYFAELKTKCGQCRTQLKEVGILKGADPETFHIDEDGIPRDKHRTYERLAEPWEYIPEKSENQ